MLLDACVKFCDTKRMTSWDMAKKSVLWGNTVASIFYLWATNSNQFNLESEWTLPLYLNKIPTRHCWCPTFTSKGQTGSPNGLIFDLWPPKSNQFILKSKLTFLPNLKKIPARLSCDIALWELDRQRDNILPPATAAAASKAKQRLHLKTQWVWI